MATRRVRLWRPALTCGAYLALSVLAYLPAWTSGLSAKAQVAGGDIAIFVWSLRWTPYALINGHNLFYSDWVNYPGGVNLLDNTSTLLLGLLAAPVTLAFGAMASFNLLQTLAFASSASAAYLLLRRWTSWFPAAFVGGLVYGFSPYMVSAGWSHLHLMFIPLLPLIVLCFDELVIRQTGSAVRWGIVLGLLVAAQFFISAELLASTMELCVVGILLLAVLHRDQVLGKLRHAATGLLTGAGVSGVLLAYPVWYMVFGPQSGRIAAGFALSSLYSADLLSPIVPTSNQLLTIPALSRLGDRFSGGLVSFGDSSYMLTNGVYLGLPLVLIVAVVAIRYRRLAIVRFFALMTVVAFVASLGPTLKIAGDLTSVRLPERVLLHLPLLEATFPYRFGAFVALGAAVLFAVGLDQLNQRSRCRYPPRVPSSVVSLLVIISALAPLIPALPYSMVTIPTPKYFRSSAVSAPSPGSVVLTYPPPTPVTSVTMMWQASAGLRYRMVGAYMFAPDDHGHFTLAPNQSVTETVLYDLWAGKRMPTLTPVLQQTIRSDLKAWDVSTVVIAMSEPRSTTAAAWFTELLGRRPRYQQDVAVWDQLPFGSGSGR